jgi:hypothetical protein
MSVQDRDDRLAAYRRQGRIDADVAEIAGPLEQRVPRSPRAERKGFPSIITRDDYGESPAGRGIGSATGGLILSIGRCRSEPGHAWRVSEF